MRMSRRAPVARVRREFGGSIACDEAILDTYDCKGYAVLDPVSFIEDRYGLEPRIKRMLGVWTCALDFDQAYPAPGREIISASDFDGVDLRPWWVFAGITMLDESQIDAGAVAMPDLFELDVEWIQQWLGLPVSLSAYSFSDPSFPETGFRHGFPDHYVIPFDISQPRRVKADSAPVFIIAWGRDGGLCCGSPTHDPNIDKYRLRWNVNVKILYQT